MRDDAVEKLIELAGLRGNPAIEGMAQAAAVSGNPRWREQLMKIVQPRVAMVEEQHPFAPSPTDEEVDAGEIRLGSLVLANGDLAEKVTVPIQSFSQHALVAGAAGAGKSWLIRHLASELSQQGVVLWFFDTENEYADLAAAHGWWPFNVAAGDFKRNFLQPLPREDPTQTLQRVRDVWRQLFLRDGSINLLGDLLLQLFTEFGVLAGSSNFPTVADLNQRLPKLRYRMDSRRGQYLESLVNRCGNLATYMATTYDVVEGYDFDELTRHSIVFELGELSADLQEFFVNDLLSALADLRMHAGQELQIVVVLDEAHRLLSETKRIRMDLGEPILYDLIRTFRKRGVGCVLATQTPSEMPSAALANVSLRLAFRIVNGTCMRTIGDSMALTHEQRAYLPEIPLRQAVVHSPDLPRAFVLQVPELDFSGGVSRAEVELRMRDTLAQLRYRKRSTNDQAPPKAQGSSQETPGTEPALTKELLDYLAAIASDPLSSMTKRDQTLGVSLWRGNQLRNELLAKGFIEIKRVKTGRRGGVLSLTEVTGKGYDCLRSMRVKVNKPRGKGGLVHAFWQEMARQWYEANYPGSKVTVEDGETGKAVDVGVEVGDKRMAVEILVSGEQKEISNVAKDLVDYDEVIMCCEDEATIERLKERVKAVLGEEYLRRISWRLLSGFIEGKGNNK